MDVELETFNISPDEIEKAMTPRTRAIVLAHLLGNPCEMGRIMAIARRHDLLVIEDACEAHGAEYRGRKAGGFGDMSTFSFFFGHHISTIEGGMLLTDDDECAELARTLRAHGWVRDRSDRDAIARGHPQIDPRYLFVNLGYNFRPTEVQGAFGVHQLKRLEGYVEARRENARYWSGQLAGLSPHLTCHSEREGTRHVWFGYPMLVKPSAPFTRAQVMAHLEEMGVETRPVLAGNIEEETVMRLVPYRKVGGLANARFIHRNAFYIGNHQGIGSEEREAVADYIRDFVVSRDGMVAGKASR
ncbi:MAG: DegT/DnrJ/EryC1/StrS family aminotransferase [Chloroflexi bacterium]|nr:DegT/DnrJ/EryC1/StrS family aminotransferase [Chloroflexota bacterium]